MPTKIIGISGTNGAGKDTVGNILAQDFGYLFVSVTDVLREEAKKRGFPADRATLGKISAEWRRQQGLAVLVDKAIERYSGQIDQYRGLAMASLRHPAEAERVHELGGIVLWLDGEPQLRYSHIIKNAVNRDRAEEDNKSFEQFLTEERVEMSPSGDDATLNMSGVKIKADFLIFNDFNGQRKLMTEVAKKLNLPSA
ncbi:MAG: AAA family ATPase [Candidatus Saccharimonadales bacterium]